MPITTERTARKTRPCGSYPCHNDIKAGDRYLRHVAFPGDEGHEEGTHPWVINECDECVTKRQAWMFDAIRRQYNVPAGRDVRIVFQGKPGVIVSAEGSGLLIRLDGEKRTIPVHPTWRMEYVGGTK